VAGAEVDVRADRARLWRSLMELAEIGAMPNGRGSNRLALTDDDAAGQRLFERWAREAGCEVARDEIGNLFARREGSEPGRLPVVVGSHLDTQPAGGDFDGTVGVLAGLEIVRTLNDAGIETAAPVVIASWANEEGARFPVPLTGSSVFAGIVDQSAAEAQTAVDGPTFGAELRRVGLAGDRPVPSFEIGSYFELHIEQSTTVEAASADVGVVERGQGIRALSVNLTGASSHSGTTAMADRRDALVAAARIVLRAHELARELDGLVTVGRLDVRPNSRAVVPGEVTLVVDVRDPDAAKIDAIDGATRAEIRSIAADAGVDAEVHVALEIPAVTFDTSCGDAIRRACRKLGLGSTGVISGAAHDAMSIARIAPSGLVFIPCRDGISHHPAEYASPDQVGAGCDTVLHTVLERAGTP
jgi:N-carbamoyl-L-amino-acid hydrolase